MKIIKINLIIIFILIILLLFFLKILNTIYLGVPIYDKLGVKLEHLKQFNKTQNSNHKEKEYLEYFKKYKSQEYIELYKQVNNITQIKKLTGIDINVFYFNDKNNCRENKEEDYINSDFVLLGDSYLWGSTINNPFDIAGTLRKKFAKKKFLNLGTPGSGPPDQLEILKNLTQKNKFKNFIWFFYEGNDYQESTIKKNGSNRIDCSWGHELQDPKFDLLNNEYVDYNYFIELKIYLSKYLRGLNSFIKKFKSYENEYNLNEVDYDLILSEASKYLENKNIENKIIYYIPSYTYQAYKKNITHPQLNKINKLKLKVREIAEKNNFQFLDGNLYLDTVYNRLDLYHYEYPTHFNALGYKLIVDQISDYFNFN